ncbi:MAG TPA: UDP-3-O-(3-hydroxymyristoyl)glucosamine N-acyltransferase [Saprospiraceae bacterium]|nr:UDP-3-O-(3-hydroxymyristoyl)glucosamine N-acyltransferase [Saprospiraceae bacterium]
MKFEHPISVKEIAKMINARMIGNQENFATGINEIHKVTPGDIAYVDVAKYFKKTIQSQAAIIILNEETDFPDGKTLLVVDNPFESYNFLVGYFSPPEFLKSPIHHKTDIHPTAIIEPGVIIGPNVSIGEGSHIQANVVLYSHVKVGKNVIIQSGTVVGSDAFYFKKTGDEYKKWNSCGRVIIEDDVYIGANCTINKGVSGDTVIGQGTKIDCLVHIAHGVVIGKNCLIAAQAGVSGKTTLEDNVILYGQVGVAPNLTIGKGAMVSPKSGIGKDLEGGKHYFGYPVGEALEKYKEIAALKQLPELIKKMRK